MIRFDKRKNTELRPFTIQRNYTCYAPGSVLVTCGNTKVLCTATIEEKVPPFLRDKKQGWLTAEYSLLPSATQTRTSRETHKPSGRTQEIQRLIGRSLRSIMDFTVLGERTIYIDADVIQADGGTRTAAISGGMVALKDACDYLLKNNIIKKNPIKELIAAISVGIYQSECILDLNYIEDSNADVDMNIIMTENGRFIEVQGTAEHQPFSQDQLQEMLALAKKGIDQIIEIIKLP